MTPLPAGQEWDGYPPALLKRRRLLLLLAWLAYIAFTLTAYPVFGVSVMLPSIVLCGVATWLYGSRLGLLTALLSHPYNVLMMMHHLNSPEGWRPALEPGGVVAQLVAIGCIAVLAGNNRKIKALNHQLEHRVNERERDLLQVSNLLADLRQSENNQLSDSLYSGAVARMEQLRKQCSVLYQCLDSEGLPEAKAAAKLAATAQSSIGLVQHLTQRLSPNAIEQYGFGRTLENLVQFYRETTPTRFTTTGLDGALDIRQDIATNLYLIANEGISNALRHGKASHIGISFAHGSGRLELVVSNDGKPSNPGMKQGLGMVLMRQRADEIGAEVELSADANGGSKLICRKRLGRMDS